VYTLHCVLYESYGMQISSFQMLLGHTFVFGDIRFRRKKTKKPKNQKNIFKTWFFQPWS